MLFCEAGHNEISQLCPNGIHVVGTRVGTRVGVSLASVVVCLVVSFVRTMAAAALAAVTTLQQKLAGENEEAVFDVVVDAFLECRLLPR